MDNTQWKGFSMLVQAKTKKVIKNPPPGVNFINIKRAHSSYERHFGSFFLRMYVRMYLCIRKKKLPKRHSYEKRARLTLMKLTPASILA